MKGPFARYAAHMLKGGYSPVPLRPGTKRPLWDKWDALKREPMTPEAIARLAIVMPQLGLGVAGGYGGLVPIDVDTDDQGINRAIAGVLPKPTVVKVGRKGWTGFYRAAGELPRARKFRPRRPDGTVGAPVVEILTTGQTVLPPTVHPDTGQPYRFASGPTLFTRPLCNLVLLTAEHIEALALALRPWCQAPVSTLHQSQPQLRPVQTKAHRHVRAYALASVRGYARRLAGARKGGRHDYLLRAANALGAYYHHGILTWGEIAGPLLQASKANNLLTDDGRNVQQTIGDGIRYAAAYQLPAACYWGRSDGR